MEYVMHWCTIEHEGNISHLRPPVIIYENVKFGEGFVCGHFTIIRENTVIGKNVSLGNRNDIEGDVEIGDNCRFHSSVHLTKFSKVGNNVFIGPGTVTTNTPHPLCKNKALNCFKGVTIEDNVKIGVNVSILPGITIGKGCVIGAGAVVTKDIPEDSIVVGNPGKIVGRSSELRCNVSPSKGCY